MVSRSRPTRPCSDDKQFRLQGNRQERWLSCGTWQSIFCSSDSTFLFWALSSPRWLLAIDPHFDHYQRHHFHRLIYQCFWQPSPVKEPVDSEDDGDVLRGQPHCLQHHHHRDQPGLEDGYSYSCLFDYKRKLMRIQETNIGEQILPMEKSLRNSACEIPVAPILRQLPSVYKYTNTQIQMPACGMPAAPMLAAVAVMEMAMIWPMERDIPFTCRQRKFSFCRFMLLLFLVGKMVREICSVEEIQHSEILSTCEMKIAATAS